MMTAANTVPAPSVHTPSAPAGLAVVTRPISAAADHVAAALHGLPPLLTSLVLVALAMAAAMIGQALVLRAVPARLRQRHPALQAFIDRTGGMLFLALAIVTLTSVVPAAPLTPATRRAAFYVLSAAFIVLLGWSGLAGIDVVTAHQLARRGKNIQDDVLARKHATQWQVLRRTAHVVIVLITFAAALMVFPGVRQYGVSLLASAGAAGLVLGLAARPVLSNLIAGIQLAITQPLRIEDAVVINDQWGWVEDITATYIVVRIWNWQRMVVPLAWLLEQPFQNWTRESAELIGSVHWHVDYTVPVPVLREKLLEIAKSSPLWTGKVVALQVTHALPATMELRALVSARNSSEAWDLRCYVREQMIDFLQRTYPAGLPKQRVDIESPPAPDRTPDQPRVDHPSAAIDSASPHHPQT